MALSQAGKGFFAVATFFVISILLIIVAVGLFAPIEDSADCEISGINVGINESMNFTGFSLNNSRIKCDISGELPAVILFVLSEAHE